MTKKPPDLPSVPTDLQRDIADRFALVPNFFKLAPEVPAIAHGFFAFAQLAYLDSPLPSLFKERLFVHLSRYCEVRYCLARHFCFLVGRGRVAGDRKCTPMDPAAAIAILKRSFVPQQQADQHLAFLRGVVGPLAGEIKPDSELETALFGVCTAIFLHPAKAQPYLPVLRRVFGIEHYEHLLLFIGFVRTANYWTQVHPELTVEDDVTEMLGLLEDISWALAWNTETGWSAIATQVDEDLKQLKAASAKRLQ